MGTDRFETLLLVAKLDGLAIGKPGIDRLGIISRLAKHGELAGRQTRG
jgi:hypothetical protein